MRRSIAGLLLGTVAIGVRVRHRRKEPSMQAAGESPRLVGDAEEVGLPEPKLSIVDQETLDRMARRLTQPQHPASMPVLVDLQKRQISSDSSTSGGIDWEEYFSFCYMSESDCLIKDMDRTKPTMVFTDSDTSRCWNGDHWAFIVQPGATEKLYFYFPGGGVCFERQGILPGVVEHCVEDFDTAVILAGYGSGAMNMSRVDNVFHDYTWVSSPYCSGDGHIGNVSYSGFWSANYQYGYNNMKFVRSWAAQNFQQTLDSFVIAGTSAGALGAGIWADTLLSEFQYEKAAVIIDSSLGVFPGKSQGRLAKSLGACDLSLLRHVKEACERDEFSMESFLDVVMAKHPNVPFAHLQSKIDATQIAFFGLIGYHFWEKQWDINEREFYRESNFVMSRLNKHPNYVAYIVDGDFHGFPGYPVEYFTTSTRGPNTTAPSGTPMLFEWVNGLVRHEPVKSQCNGPMLRNGAMVPNYCARDLFPKSLSV